MFQGRGCDTLVRMSRGEIAMNEQTGEKQVIRTPDQKLRVFISSTLRELADERAAAKAAVGRLRLSPVMFELGARAHPPRALYRAYLDQSQVFVGIYWQSYGWVAPEEQISGLEDEYRLSGDRPKLIYVKTPSPEREPRLKELLKRIQTDDQLAYNTFETPEQLRELLENDLAVLLTEEFESARLPQPGAPASQLNLPPLPVPATPLLGRERECAEICALLRAGDVRLVTLLGPGGIGKTRLALHTATLLQNDFRDGVCLVDLSAIRDPALVMATVAQTIGLRESSLSANAGQTADQSLESRLAALLRDKQLLLILDNFEQVLSAAPALAQLLASAPQLEVIITSRAALRLRGEHEYGVQPLALPTRAGSETVPLAVAAQNPAVMLFAQRARAVSSTFILNEQNANTVAEICALLDAVPLAIELAAARIRLLPPGAIRARLAENASMQLLTGGARDLPERQRTLQNAVDWSYQLLNPQEQTFFSKLTIFSGGWTLEAAEAVCGAPGVDGLELMSSLIDKCLVQSLASVDAAPRFSMLRVIHDYASAKLAVADLPALAQAHATYYHQLVVANAPKLRGARQLEALSELDAELNNIRAALCTLIDSGQTRAAADMAAEPWLYWVIQARFTEGLRWLEEIVEKMNPDDPQSPRIRALLTGPLGGLFLWKGDYERALPLLTQACDLYRSAGLRGGLASALSALSILAVNREDWSEAESLIEEGLAINREIKDDWGIALSLSIAGWLASRRGEYEKSAQIYQESVARAVAIGDKLNESFAWVDLGRAHLLRHDYERARAMFQTSLDLARALRYKTGLAYGAEGLACVDMLSGQVERGVRLFGAAQALRTQTGAPPWRLDRPMYEQILADARSLLGAEAFEQLLADGGLLTVEAALADRAGG